MKKLLLLGLVLSLSTGCGRGWLPCLFRGASCNSTSCLSSAPALPEGCANCGHTAGYADYNAGYGEIVNEGIGSGVINPGYSGAAITNPPMSNLPSAGN